MRSLKEWRALQETVDAPVNQGTPTEDENISAEDVAQAAQEDQDESNAKTPLSGQIKLYLNYLTKVLQSGGRGPKLTLIKKVLLMDQVLQALGIDLPTLNRMFSKIRSLKNMENREQRRDMMQQQQSQQAQQQQMMQQQAQMQSQENM